MPHAYFSHSVSCPKCGVEIHGIDSRIERLPEDTKDKKIINHIANIASLSDDNPRIGTHCYRCKTPLVIIDEKTPVEVTPIPELAKEVIEKFKHTSDEDKQSFVDNLSIEELGSIVVPDSLEDEQSKNSIP